MKNTSLVLLVLALTVSMSGLSRHKRSSNHTGSRGAVSQRDLNATLTNLEHAASATNSDIARMRIDKWGAGWKPGFLGGNSHTKEAEQTALSIRRNLVGALPGLIGDVRDSHGSMTATFKLYDDLSVLFETLGSLLSAADSYGRKDEYRQLAQDFSTLSHIRRHLSSYIQMKAAALEGTSVTTSASSRGSRATRGSKVRTISDDE